MTTGIRATSFAALAALGLLCVAGPGGCKKREGLPTSKKDDAMSDAKKIEFYEDDKLTASENAADVPDEIRYVTVEGKRVEVAKVVARTQGDTRSIEQYGADGRLLMRTLQRKFSVPKPPSHDGR